MVQLNVCVAGARSSSGLVFSFLSLWMFLFSCAVLEFAQYQRENAEQIMNAQACKAEEYAAALAARKGELQQTGVDLVSYLSVKTIFPLSQTRTSNVPQGQYAPAVAGVAQPQLMGSGPQPIPLGSGHDMMGLEYEDEETMRQRAGKAAWAGALSAEMSKKRALEEAFASIWI